MTTNCGQLPTPNSVIGAATLTTASHGPLRERPEWSVASRPAPEARSAEERKQRGSTARSDHLRTATLVRTAAS
jgi:hypothetical protein